MTVLNPKLLSSLLLEEDGALPVLVRVLRSSSHSGVGWGLAPHRCYPHRTDDRQGEKQTAAECVQTSDIGSTAWGWEHGRTGTLSYPTWGCAGREGTSGVRKMARRGNGLLSLFPVNLYARGQSDQQTDGISSSDVPSGESL
jgi:hypothetical protein